MKNDTDFLYDSILANYFNFSSESDPFLISLSSEFELNNKDKSTKRKITIPINDDIMNSIKNW